MGHMRSGACIAEVILNCETWLWGLTKLADVKLRAIRSIHFRLIIMSLLFEAVMCSRGYTSTNLFCLK